jgi:hypothetical protein
MVRVVQVVILVLTVVSGWGRSGWQEGKLAMAHTKIDTGCILEGNKSVTWSPWTPAPPHEMVQALADIIEVMQERIDELEAWRKRVQGDEASK